MQTVLQQPDTRFNIVVRRVVLEQPNTPLNILKTNTSAAPVTQSCYWTIQRSSSRSNDTLSAMYSQVINTPKLCDMTLMARGGERHPAHRSVVATVCPKLHNQIMEQDGEVSVKIYFPMLSINTLARLIQFWYTGEVSLSTADQVLELSDFVREYQVHDLGNCLEQIYDNSWFLYQNYLQVWTYAHKYDDFKLEAAVAESLRESGEDLTASPDFVKIPFGLMTTIVQLWSDPDDEWDCNPEYIEGLYTFLYWLFHHECTGAERIRYVNALLPFFLLDDIPDDVDFNNAYVREKLHELARDFPIAAELLNRLEKPQRSYPTEMPGEAC